MNHRLFRLSNVLLAGAAIALLITAAACKTAPSSTTPAASPQASTPAPSPTSARPTGPFGRTPTNSTPTAAASTTTTPTQVPTATPAASPPATASSPTPSAVKTTPPATTTIPGQTATPPATSVSVNVFPIISITSPYYMSTLPAGEIIVNSVVSNFNLVNKIGQTAAPGEGHIVYYLDAVPPTTAGQSATAITGLFADSLSTTYTWHNVTSGMHTLSVQLVNNDDTPLSPPVTSTETIIVQ